MLYIGCGTWAGNPTNDGDGVVEGDSEVQLNIVGSNGLALLNAPIEVTDTGGSVIGSITLTQASVGLKEIKLSNSGENQNIQKFEGPYLANLLTNQVTPALGQIKVPAGGYNSLKVGIEKLDSEKISQVAEGSSLDGKSIYLVGSFKDLNGVSKPLQMDFELSEELEIQTTGEIDIEKGVANKLTMAFDFSVWFDFSNADYDFNDLASSSIVLTKDAEDETAKKLQEYMKEQIKNSIKLEKELE